MPFVKGQSGNPAGRRKKTAAEREVEDLARDHGPDAIARLRHWMDSADARASVTAATALLDRAYGKPKQRNEHTGAEGGPVSFELVWGKVE